MLVIGIRFFTWGAERTLEALRCGQCGAVTPFLVKKGMRFITLFFIIPVIPISNMKHILECPNCKARFQSQA
jgi:transcription elongation factor Elf1